jgi:hypothetical protein
MEVLLVKEGVVSGEVGVSDVEHQRKEKIIVKLK